MTSYKSISDKDNQITILLEINDEIHLVAFDKEAFETLNLIIKNAVRLAIPTKKTQAELNDFLNYTKGVNENE